MMICFENWQDINGLFSYILMFYVLYQWTVILVLYLYHWENEIHYYYYIIDLCILMIKIPNFLCCKLNRANCRYLILSSTLKVGIILILNTPQLFRYLEIWWMRQCMETGVQTLVLTWTRQSASQNLRFPLHHWQNCYLNLEDLWDYGLDLDSYNFFLV